MGMTYRESAALARESDEAFLEEMQRDWRSEARTNGQNERRSLCNLASIQYERWKDPEQKADMKAGRGDLWAARYLLNTILTEMEEPSRPVYCEMAAE